MQWMNPLQGQEKKGGGGSPTDKHLEDMEGLKLYRGGLVLQQRHDRLEVLRRGDVPCHHREVGAVEEELAEELEGLPACHVVV